MINKLNFGIDKKVVYQLSNCWTYRFSGSQTVDLNDVYLEFGVQVDQLLTNPTDLSPGKDHFIEAAVEWLKQ